jgi:hypothetical protein
MFKFLSFATADKKSVVYSVGAFAFIFLLLCVAALL